MSRPEFDARPSGASARWTSSSLARAPYPKTASNRPPVSGRRQAETAHFFNISHFSLCGGILRWLPIPVPRPSGSWCLRRSEQTGPAVDRSRRWPAREVPGPRRRRGPVSAPERSRQGWRLQDAAFQPWPLGAGGGRFPGQARLIVGGGLIQRPGVDRDEGPEFPARRYLLGQDGGLAVEDHVLAGEERNHWRPVACRPGGR